VPVILKSHAEHAGKGKLAAMIPLAHGDLGSADEIIPAILAGLLLIFVLVRAFVDFVKGKIHDRSTLEPSANPDKPIGKPELLD